MPLASSLNHHLLAIHGRYGNRQAWRAMRRFLAVGTAIALAGCGGSRGHTTSSTAPQAAHPPSAAEQVACTQFDAVSVPENTYSTVTLSNLTAYAQAVQKLLATAYGPHSTIVTTAANDVNSLPAVGPVTAQQLAQVDRDAASVGTFCGQILAG